MILGLSYPANTAVDILTRYLENNWNSGGQGFWLEHVHLTSSLFPRFITIQLQKHTIFAGLKMFGKIRITTDLYAAKLINY